MLQIKNLLRRYAPSFARGLYSDLKDRLSGPPDEEVVLHEYLMVVDLNPKSRINLVIPTVAQERAFGGVSTGLEIFLDIGRRVDADLRIILDEYGPGVDRGLVDKLALSIGLDPSKVEILPRATRTPRVSVRRGDIFIAYNWWAALNLRPLIRAQSLQYSQTLLPLLYLIQEYEPQFYPFSSTHMMARAAYDSHEKLWAIINSSQLRQYLLRQGHTFDREYVFEPRLSRGLLRRLNGQRPGKEKRILVYGRPTIARNCFPAMVAGLRDWAKRYPEFSDWSITSAGMWHRPVKIEDGRSMESKGKMSLDEYAEFLLTTGVGLSLMASPHPSYPPLEMAHFGARTITNAYTDKSLESAHDNIISIKDISAATISDALADACREFQASPSAGWRAKSNIPGFLQSGDFQFMDQLVLDLTGTAWSGRSAVNADRATQTA